MKRTGQTFWLADLARDYGFTDVDVTSRTRASSTSRSSRTRRPAGLLEGRGRELTSGGRSCPVSVPNRSEPPTAGTTGSRRAPAGSSAGPPTRRRRGGAPPTARRRRRSGRRSRPPRRSGRCSRNARSPAAPACSRTSRPPSARSGRAGRVDRPSGPRRWPGRTRLALRVSEQALLACFQKLLAPAVVEVRSDAFAAAERGDALLAPQALDYDPDLFLGGKPSAGLPPDLSNRLLGRCLLLHGSLLLSEPGTLS